MRFLIVFLIFVANISIAQSDFKLEIIGGTDNSLLKPMDSNLKFKSTITGFFGLAYVFECKDKSDLRLGSFIGRKRSVDESTLKYNNTYISFFSNYYLPLSPKLSFSLGPQYSVLINSYTEKGAVEKQMHGYNSYLALNAGVEYKLQKNLNIGLVYEAPLFDSKLASWPNFKVKLGITIDQNLFKGKERAVRQLKSNTKIKDLRNTAMLVSLHGFAKQINAYRENGNEQMARNIEYKRDEINRTIVDAFITEFDFCPVYFFYNYDSKKIKEKNFDNVFVNSDLKNDSLIEFDLETFMIGSLGFSVTDTNISYSYVDVYKNGYNNAAGYTRSSMNESDISHYGFSIMDQNFEYIEKPFPRFVNGYFLVVKKSIPRIIVRINDKLYKYYK